MQKNFCFFKQCKLCYIVVVRVNKQQHLNSPVDIRNVLENCDMEVLNYLNLVKNLLIKCLTQNLVPLKFKNAASRETWTGTFIS